MSMKTFLIQYRLCSAQHSASKEPLVNAAWPRSTLDSYWFPGCANRALLSKAVGQFWDEQYWVCLAQCSLARLKWILAMQFARKEARTLDWALELLANLDMYPCRPKFRRGKMIRRSKCNLIETLCRLLSCQLAGSFATAWLVVGAIIYVNPALSATPAASCRYPHCIKAL